MDIFISIWVQISMIAMIVFYISVIIILILLEKHFIKKRSKGELILPIVVLAAALLLSMHCFEIREHKDSGLSSVQIFNENTEVGHLFTVHDGERKLKAIGQFVTREGKHSKFVDIEIEDGKVVWTSQPIDSESRKGIEENVSYYSGQFSGKTVPYEELVRIGRENEYTGTFINGNTFLYGGIWFGIPALIPLMMYLVSKLKRKRRNAYNKTKLEDLRKGL